MARPEPFDLLEEKRREQVPQALARLVVVALFIVLWVNLWLLRIPMPVPFLLVLVAEALFFVGYWRLIYLLRSARAIYWAHNAMLAAEIVFHTTMVYFLGTITWLGPFAYMFGMVFANTFLDLRRGFLYTSGALAAFITLIMLEATRTIPHYQFLAQGPLRYTDEQFVTTTVVGAIGVFASMFVWVNWVGSELRRQRDAAVQTQEHLFQARAALQRANEELERRVRQRTMELEEANAALRQSEERLRAVVANAPIVLFSVNQDGIFTLSEGKGLEALGLRPGEVVNQSVFEIYRDVPAIERNIRRALAGEAFTAAVHVGDLFYETHYAPLRDEAGGICGVIGVASDVTERVRAEQELREREASTRALLEAIPDMMFRIHRDGTILDFKPAHDAAGQPNPTEIIGRSAYEFLPGEAGEGARAQIERALETGQPQLFEFALSNGDGETTYRESRIVACGEDEVLALVRDVTERKRTEEALREQARRDPLTGVLNHAAIVSELRAIADDESTSHVVVMADLDSLKAINDVYGHQFGDEALILVAKALQRDGAVVGRYGGDEFVAILRGCERADAERYRTAVLDRLARARLTDSETGDQIPVVISLGYALHPRDARTVHELIQISDSAMYAAKRQRPARGRNPTFVRPLGADRAAELVGQLVPLLTAPGSVNEKLKLVAHRLSVGAGYDAVTFTMFAPAPGHVMAGNTFARAPDELVEAWQSIQETGQETPDFHPMRKLMERTKRPVILDDPWHDDRLWAPQREVLRRAELRSALAAPLIWEDTIVGLIGVASRRAHAFGPSDAQFLATVATQVSAIIRMATLLDQLQATSNRLQEAREETVLLLAAAAEAHDLTTGQHLHHLHQLTEALALELGYGAEEAREIGIAAMLHDIGKIRVPEAVLARPDKLADEEWELMKHHTTWGANFLAGHAGFELAATIARSHHERWDGTGYPDGLAGEAIPEAAAIVSVADAFDAITSDRPYRKARSVSAALREIEANAGRQFSPKVVQALRRLHRQRRLKLTRADADRTAA